MTSFSTFVQNSIFCTLHHKTSRHRLLDIRISYDKIITPPSILNDTWTTPFEIVGLASKKAKMATLRFHPNAESLFQEHSELVSRTAQEVKEFLSTLISGSEWSFKEPVDARHCLVRKVATFLLEKKGIFTIATNCVFINWTFNPENNCKKHVEVCQEASHILHNDYIGSSFITTVSVEDNNKHNIEIHYVRPDFDLLVFKLELIGSTLQTGLIENAIQVFESGVQLKLPFLPSLTDYKPVPLISSCVVYIEKKHRDKMLDAGQLRVETLRRRLDESLISFQKSAVQKDRDARSLHIIRVSPKEALVEIGEHGARPRMDRILASSSPLNVICDGSSMSELATSPAESIDSGISLSPVTSPVGKHSPFYQYSEENRLGMRQRSASESEWASEGLKGILKKPAPRALRLARSVSESCHSHTVGPFGLVATLEEDEGEYVEDGEDEGHSDEPTALAPRKKSVSFSEKLEQCRRFRPNQCIVSQARKNEKRRLQKRRKEDERRRLSCGSESEGHESADAKPCLRNERQDSGFVDSSDSPPASPLPTEEDAWAVIIRNQRKAMVAN